MACYVWMHVMGTLNMNLQTVADAVETEKFDSSAVHQYIGGNVKSPGLIKNQHYIVKYWSLESVAVGDNPYWVGMFLGAGEVFSDILSTTPRAKDLTETQRYFFKKVNDEIVAASNHKGSLVVNSEPDQRITFYALQQESQQGALPFASNAVRAIAKPAADPSRPLREHSKIVRTPRLKREKPADITVEQFSETLARLAQKKIEYKMFYVAVFKQQQAAVEFSSRFKNGICVMENQKFLSRVPEDDNRDADFFSKAKSVGADDVYKHNAILQ